MVALIALPVAAVWGHAEDALAMTFAIYALIAMLDRKWSRCGWLIGFGIVMQPLVLLLLPLILAATPAGQRALTAVRSAALSVVLLTVAFIGNPADTYRAVVQQPAFPTANHVTPWLATGPDVVDREYSDERSGLSPVRPRKILHRRDDGVPSTTPWS